MRLELTEQQKQTIDGLRKQGEEVVEVGDPAAKVNYVLITRTHYEQIRSLLGHTAEPGATPPVELVVAPGILRSQRAYRRDLPELLARKEWLRKWVCYRGDERIGIAPTKLALMRECLKRGWNDDEFMIGIIEPQGFIEEEELDPQDPSHLVEESSS